MASFSISGVDLPTYQMASSTLIGVQVFGACVVPHDQLVEHLHVPHLPWEISFARNLLPQHMGASHLFLGSTVYDIECFFRQGPDV